MIDVLGALVLIVVAGCAAAGSLGADLRPRRSDVDRDTEDIVLYGAPVDRR